ncbi:JAB domain-containing protein [Zunongwangia pacifica]|uniref:JAB domain-containing protein n=1 Tax=Zunongwangia pacifica TaxID=2911062 RepID=A0A9X1ZR87_9FLAO|nr:JAB domain-containing protein [Zunongwangia pacifica]MCL6218586.1 JAB domain-containing protein [Zunongwangia pacifica]
MEISEINVSYSNNNNSCLKIKSSRHSYEILRACWNDGTIELQEEFKILMLNRGSQVLGIYPLSKGGVSGTLVDAKLVFSVALKCNASAIILAHNHPSGNLKSSEADRTLTRRLKSAADFLDIKLLDHIILSKDNYLSFADEGML